MAETSGGATSTRDELLLLLRQKEHDIDIAAQIGQTLLERNRELQTRNEFLEESLAQSAEQTTQLRHELQTRIQLLRCFSLNDDDQADDDSTTAALCRQMEKLRRENVRLTAESSVLRKQIEGAESEKRREMMHVESQLATITAQALKLQAAITKKNEECNVHGENITKLLEEVAKRSHREKNLCQENESLVEQLEDALRRESELSEQMSTMQDMYAELKSMFNDAEEELRTYRKKPSPYRTPSSDSLYDSLASELETSDSGWTPRHQRDHVPRRLEPQCLEEAPKEEQLAIEAATPLVPLADEPSSSNLLSLPDKGSSEDESPSMANELAALPTSSNTAAAEGTEEACAKDDVQPSTSEACDVAAPRVENPRNLPRYLDPPQSLALAHESGEYEEEDTPRAPSRNSSNCSLVDYEAPSLGEPGVPGTRDLRVSIKKKDHIQRQLEKDYAAFRARRGLRPSAFFQKTPQQQQPPSLLSPYLMSDARSLLPWSICTTVGLHGVKPTMGTGVVTRAELPSLSRTSSPTSSPSHSGSGLQLALHPTTSLSSISGGIVLRRPF